jgi:hypothetical protein
MKRRALLFGNTNGLNGVKKDITNFAKFLTSDIGGQWYFDSEISILMNPSRNEILNKINLLKNERPDFAFVVFSGHGAYSRGTILEINNKGDFIHESELRGIASRQISIFDCCRNVDTTALNESRTFSKALLQGDAVKNIRPFYDSRIMQAIEQQTSLYACSVGESSYDTNDGGIYTNCFLSSVRPDSQNQFKLLAIAQDEARPKTTRKAFEVYSGKQTPDQSIPRCISSQQLIISINPNLIGGQRIFG